MQEKYDDRMLQQLAKMADCRKGASVPDVDAEWERFKSKHVEPKKTRKSNVVAMWSAALAGAAAMLVGVLIYINVWGTNDRLIALNYDETPRMITLACDGELEDLTEKDSISFFSINKESGHIKNNDELLASNVPANEPEKLQSLSTPRGMDFKVTLHDGTEVWMNAESTIEFPASFTGNERKVNLKGEAYFKVARNESKPFIVNLGDKTIRVLGTEFDVRNYASEVSQVVLVNGSVLLCDADGKEEATLKPGESASWMEDETPWISKADIYGTTQWLEGLFYFEEHALGLVLRDIGRWYNYGVEFKNEKHYNYKVHFSADRNDDIQHIINDLNTLCGFEIAIENKKIVVY